MKGDMDIDDLSNKINTEHNKLNNDWTLWAHLPHDTDWSTKSYKNVHTMTTVEDTIALTESLPEVLVVNCMLFIMKKGIIPVWEDKHNRGGGCFSYKIANKSVYSIWKELTYLLVGETLSTDKGFVENITGITISPKKSFCIIKIWMSNCEYQNPELVTSELKGIQTNGCIFKKHQPEY
jgi:translation initiation factor 4E